MMLENVSPDLDASAVAGGDSLGRLDAQHEPCEQYHHSSLRLEETANQIREVADATADSTSRSVARDSAKEDDDGDFRRGSSDDDGSDEDRYRIVSNPDVVRAASALRRRGDAAFREWISKSERLRSNLSSGVGGGMEHASAGRLIQRNEEKRIIATPREYQIELFERAKEKNLIIVLDTGSGKTLIAALLLRFTLDQELERRAEGGAKKVAFFLVENVALCFQQYSVLRANLEHPVAKFHGEMTGILRTKEFWDQQLDENMVLVCTAQILLDCLNSGFLQMSRVNLLIFDEAHHTKKNHPYARIIKEHYLRKRHDRPRILGMTASPVDAQTRDLRGAAADLESIMCSEIATVSDETLAEGQNRRRQIEMKEYYARLVRPEDAKTPLSARISNLISHEPQYRMHFEAAQDVASTLGPWCADRYWLLLMTDAEVDKQVAKARERDNRRQTVDREGEADRVLSVLCEVQNAVRLGAVANDEIMTTATRMTDPHLFAFSSKVKTLRQILEDAFKERVTTRCIVFVKKRYTALLLAQAFQLVDMQIPAIHASHLIGSRVGAASIANMSFRDQVVALQRFRRGDTNCLFATQVAEEGIDIPECDFIIRFDLYDSAIQYIQSKGRARKDKSTYISMLEEGNMQHLRKLKQATRDAISLRQFCTSLPSDRKIQDNFDAVTLAENERIAQRVHEIPETGARLSFASSLEVLAKFVSSLTDSHVTPDYVVTSSSTSKKFVATVILPEESPIKCKRGFAQRNKQLARGSAAFEACVELIEKKYINGHLQPTLSRRLPAMRNARLALSSNRREEYTMRVRSEIWCQLGYPATLFQHTYLLDNPEATGRRTHPILLLTRKPLPKMEPMLFYFGKRTSAARLVGSAMPPLELASDEVDALAKFTLAIFRDVFSKDFNATPEELPYFIAPCAAIPVDGPSAASVDWNMMNMVAHDDVPEWRGAPEAFFAGKMAIDPWDGSRKFLIHGINKSLKPSDPVPEGVPMPKCRAYRLVEQTIKEYSNSLSIKSRQRQTWDEGQPVLDAELLSLRRNFMDEDTAERGNADMGCCIILEPLVLSKLPADIVSMAIALPVMMYRLDSALIALEACRLLGLGDIRSDLALEALTKDSSHTEEHDRDQVGFQVGMSNNYERLEFLGDAFLKMATTISLFTLMPNTNEFEYHVERMLLVCNQNLFNHAVDIKLQEFVRSKSFDRRTWYPSNLRLTKGKAPKTEATHRLADKSVADVCEALIGAAYVTQKRVGKTDLAVQAVTKMVKSKNHRMTKFSQYYDAFKMPEWQVAVGSATQHAAVERIFEATGYRFRSSNLLRSVFKHPSYPYEAMIPNYQRLEFLGDALLDLVIVDYLFDRFPDADPQWLTEHKMAMASNHFFGSLCVQLGLQKHLLTTTAALVGQISDFVTELELARAGVDEAGGHRRDYWLDTSQPPKVLSDLVEALVGGLFVDSRYDLSTVHRFFSSHIEPFFDDMARYDTYASRQPVTVLVHVMQNRLGCQNWRLYLSVVPGQTTDGVAAVTEDEAVCALMVHEQAVEHATAKTGRDAKLVVAKAALRRFEKMERNDFQALVGCYCLGRGPETRR
ncbi:RNase3 domain-containing protein [Drechmeria coniospora]|uniref:Dicer-like protein 1 n=1 Tax=Drechmeria coniospora TaxID=98403 RepID=A0A151GK11_DRECN|nr:RNase3 domain-containing protein [Drechmeria coniospora]KYK57428.1 RNase3 domain-containing protein [Drechmeria coniospora]